MKKVEKITSVYRTNRKFGFNGYKEKERRSEIDTKPNIPTSG